MILLLVDLTSLSVRIATFSVQWKLLYQPPNLLYWPPKLLYWRLNLLYLPWKLLYWQKLHIGMGPSKSNIFSKLRISSCDCLVISDDWCGASHFGENHGTFQLEFLEEIVNSPANHLLDSCGFCCWKKIQSYISPWFGSSQSWQDQFLRATHSGLFPKVLLCCENVDRQDDFANFWHFLTRFLSFFNPIDFF